MGEMLLNGRLYGASGIRELTQAQYDALPASKLTDGVLYCIKDDGIVEGDKYAPIIYSLDERVVGVFTDGKPLYQKTIHKTNVTPSSTDTVLVLASEISPNLDSVRRISGMFGRMQVNSSPYGTDGYNVVWGTGSTYYHYNWYNENAPHVWLTYQYTKTTDVPGSGHWGTDGVPMVHYDGTEKVVGTWFGETLYEKTIIPTTFPQKNYWDYFILLDTNAVCREVSGYITYANGFTIPINLSEN